MKLLMDELKIFKFDMETDCKSQWDTISEEEMEKCRDMGWEDVQKRRNAKFVG